MEDKYSAQKKYHSDHKKTVSFAFIVPHEQDIYDYLKDKPNQAGYIKSLIREDMERQK